MNQGQVAATSKAFGTNKNDWDAKRGSGVSSGQDVAWGTVTAHRIDRDGQLCL